MDTTHQPISSASFIGQVFRLLVKKLQRRESLKLEILISVVILCTFARYTIVSKDESLLLQNKPVAITMQYLKLPIWPPELILKSTIDKKKINNKLKLQVAKFKQTEKSFYLFTRKLNQIERD